MTRPAPLEVEQVVAQAWRTALNLEVLPPNANVFNLGGDSLIAVMIASDIGEQLGAEVGLADLIEAPFFGDFVVRVAELVTATEG
jgi:acyl carrier protein